MSRDPNAPIIIGLKGERQTGKSKFADYLVSELGFHSVHPFNGGKVACRAYFEHCGADQLTAYEMTNGKLKDVPSPYLPVIKNPEHGMVGEHYHPRYFMEVLGRCMGVEMGHDFTIGKELELARQAMERRGGRALLVIESIVYEADTVRAHGGSIIEVTRDLAGVERPKGMHTDEFGRTVRPDLIFCNDFDNLEAMRIAIDELLVDRYDLRKSEPEAEFAI